MDLVARGRQRDDRTARPATGRGAATILARWSMVVGRPAVDARPPGGCSRPVPMAVGWPAVDLTGRSVLVGWHHLAASGGVAAPCARRRGPDVVSAIVADQPSAPPSDRGGQPGAGW